MLEKNIPSLHNNKIINRIREEVKNSLKGESTGHDWFHIERILKNAQIIMKGEQKQHDEFIIKAAALLHDIADWKFHGGNEETGPQKALEMLLSLGVDTIQAERIAQIIREVSFKGAGVDTKPTTIEGMIVQDADRLDALGAIGIARTFAYGGYRGQPIYDPSATPQHHLTFNDYKKSTSTTINHFYEKLLLLTDRMNTQTAKKIAQRRHTFMQKFLKQFFQEWEGNT